jgi:hypothetical protein
MCARKSVKNIGVVSQCVSYEWESCWFLLFHSNNRLSSSHIRLSQRTVMCMKKMFWIESASLESDLNYLLSYILHVDPGWLSRYSHWLRAGRPRGRSSSPGRVKNFLFFMSSRPALGSTQSPTKWVKKTIFFGVRWLGLEADHSPPTTAEINKTWVYTSTPPDNFTFFTFLYVPCDSDHT